MEGLIKNVFKHFRFWYQSVSVSLTQELGFVTIKISFEFK
jgi:hypothetical protein